MKSVLLLGILAGVGCATVEGTRQNAPLEIRTYAGDVDSFETCMLMRHNRVKNSGMFGGVYLQGTGMRRKSEFAELELSCEDGFGGTRTFALLTVRRIDEKRFVVEYRKGANDLFDVWRKKVWPLVEDCAGPPESRGVQPK